MQRVQTGKEKQMVYSYEYRRLKKAISEQFYLEAVAISYAVIEDRLTAFLHYAGIVFREEGDLSINKPVYPYIRTLLEKKDSDRIQIRQISVKTEIVRRILSLSESRSAEIDDLVLQRAESPKRIRFAQRRYMEALEKQIRRSMNKEAVEEMLDELKQWCDNRNHLIHALMNILTSEEEKREAAEKGKELARKVDDLLVKPFKNNNRIRKQFQIQ